MVASFESQITPSLKGRLSREHAFPQEMKYQVSWPEIDLSQKKSDPALWLAAQK